MMIPAVALFRNFCEKSCTLTHMCLLGAMIVEKGGTPALLPPPISVLGILACAACSTRVSIEV